MQCLLKRKELLLAEESSTNKKMTYIKQDVNSVLLLLVLFTCTALIALTVVFAYQFEQVNVEVSSAKEQLDSASKDIDAKSIKLSELERTSVVQKEREQVLRNLLGRK